MESVEAAYDQWAESYDNVVNPTRDLDRKAMQEMLREISFHKVLELGCGTGKNTSWLATRCGAVTAVDLSSEMLQRAKEKTRSPHVSFIKADINQPWNFISGKYDLLTCNLVLEHIQDLDAVFEKANGVIEENGWLFICELHPVKQYTGSKARFEQNNETVVVDCYTHHLTDYLAAGNFSFRLVEIREWFDDDYREIPRLISFIFRKK